MRGGRLYNIWVGMRQRIRNPKASGYLDYGGRGITIDSCWETFLTFKEWAINNGYSEELSIERRNVNGHYSPSNCYWADTNIQACNKRKRSIAKHQYIGIRPIHGGRWRAVINVSKKQLSIGCFSTEIEAVQARDLYIQSHTLPHALNL